MHDLLARFCGVCGQEISPAESHWCGMRIGKLLMISGIVVLILTLLTCFVAIVTNLSLVYLPYLLVFTSVAVTFILVGGFIYGWNDSPGRLRKPD